MTHKWAWYNGGMKREFLKEAGKYILDLSKIMFAIAFITPLAKGMTLNVPFTFAMVVVGVSGLYLTYKGAKDDD